MSGGKGGKKEKDPYEDDAKVPAGSWIQHHTDDYMFCGCAAELQSRESRVSCKSAAVPAERMPCSATRSTSTTVQHTMKTMSTAVLALAAGAAGFLPSMLPPRLARAGQPSSFMIMNAGRGGQHQDAGGPREGLTRAHWLQATSASAVAIGVGLTALSPSSVSAAAAESGPNGLPASGFFVQHAVFKVPDMDAEVKFFTEGLGMKVVRQREVNGARNVFVAYGAETLANKSGGYFSLELVYDPKAPPGYTSGGPFQYLGLSIDSTLATIAYKVDAADVLGMKEQDAGLLKILGPLAGEALRLSGYDKNGVSVALNPVDAKIYEGGTFGKLAVLTKDTKALAEKVAASGGAKKVGGGDVLFAGEVPGIGTKVANTIDFEGRGVVFVDYEDFEGEMKPPSPQEGS
eukprot:g15929.t1